MSFIQNTRQEGVSTADREEYSVNITKRSQLSKQKSEAGEQHWSNAS